MMYYCPARSCNKKVKTIEKVSEPDEDGKVTVTLSCVRCKRELARYKRPASQSVG